MQKTNASLVYAIWFHESAYGKWCVDRSIWQTENSLERGFVKRLTLHEDVC